MHYYRANISIYINQLNFNHAQTSFMSYKTTNNILKQITSHLPIVGENKKIQSQSKKVNNSAAKIMNLTSQTKLTTQASAI